MIVMNEDTHGEARIRKGRKNHQGATQNEDIKLMLVNGYRALTPTITPTLKKLKMKVLPDQEKEGVEMIIMNEEHLGEARIRKGRTSHQRATQNEDIKLMLVNGYPVPTPTTTPREVITPTPNILKMKVLPV